MDTNTLAIIFQEGGRLITALIRYRPVKSPELAVTPSKTESEQLAKPSISQEIVLTEESKASSVKSGCVPCSLGHLGTCSGLLNEATRFARKEGIDSNEVISRVNMCLDELNALERVDLRPEMITSLSPWEKELSVKALDRSRETRHDLESLSSVDSLEKVAAGVQGTRQEIGRLWFQHRLAQMSPEEKRAAASKALEIVEKGSILAEKQMDDLKAMRDASRIRG